MHKVHNVGDNFCHKSVQKNYVTTLLSENRTRKTETYRNLRRIYQIRETNIAFLQSEQRTTELILKSFRFLHSCSKSRDLKH
jgi:DNA-binding LytR/AlgR family response regulator